MILKRVVPVCTLLCWLVLSGQGQGHHMDFRHLDYSDGLPDMGSIQDVMQDPMGRVWLAYDRGLFRYDGHEIVRLVHSPTDSNSVAEEFVGALFVAGDGRIWAGTANRGISIFDPVAEHFSHIRTEAEGGPLPMIRIWSMKEDHDGTLWIATNSALIRLDQATYAHQEFHFDHPGYTQRQLDYLNDGRKTLEDPRNPDRLFYATRGGLLSFRKSQETFELHRMPFAGMDSLDYLINDFLFSDSTMLWMGTWGGFLLQYNTAAGTWKQYNDPKDISGQGIIRTIERRSNQTLWVVGTPGFGYFDMNNGIYHYYRHDPDDTKSLSDLVVPGMMLFTQDSTLMVIGRRGISISDPFPGYRATQEQFKPYLDEIRINGHPIQMDTATAY
ncbi:MAG: two-component regulator propeller domain-containing protein, partial [Saprospiraceae bacterium]|nr:two-component regulator propeller domain-containing protein [Saprospiraceae bacterium]